MGGNLMMTFSLSASSWQPSGLGARWDMELLGRQAPLMSLGSVGGPQAT